jgi:putative addiction module component (TIGR02574 family)
MTEEAAELLKKALTLSVDERAELAGSLLESLEEDEDQATVESAWNEEIARRVADLDSGKEQAIPWEDVRKLISSKLPDGR